MTVSRRKFLWAAAGAATAGVSLGGPTENRKPEVHVHAFNAERSDRECVLLDLTEDCGLRESRAGYAAALGSLGVDFTRVSAGAFPRAQTLIVAACVVTPPGVARSLRESLGRGSTVLVESGAGFAELAKWAAHERFLQANFELRVKPPVSLWKGAAERPRIPYVDYLWPVPARVRDFSRVIPLSEPAGDLIGRVGDLPVALRRTVGKGTLVFLGSPLGPALLSGDREARGWLARLLLE